jgi:hypothetical protein
MSGRGNLGLGLPVKELVTFRFSLAYYFYILVDTTSVPSSYTSGSSALVSEAV